jgi:hypothetical protein
MSRAVNGPDNRKMTVPDFALAALDGELSALPDLGYGHGHGFLLGFAAG